ncbi:M3 family metallopeptidase [Pseudoalteromonas byunsanensis]|uniref:Peptidase M3A/M3B catalytic domain-containing protein n=1 Tax=Pseudoalteromonas byunsanensis TaxID=327939 RepID=A0A1S1N781_9GAMM|nr:M3 family metallopeptidase [Pseudoalteromonas byunsanensis]OHU95199.1 hypothetical protein BIW53_10765 [Pseudoalteromonas byunsanensis]
MYEKHLSTLAELLQAPDDNEKFAGFAKHSKAAISDFFETLVACQDCFEPSLERRLANGLSEIQYYLSTVQIVFSISLLEQYDELTDELFCLLETHFDELQQNLHTLESQHTFASSRLGKQLISFLNQQQTDCFGENYLDLEQALAFQTANLSAGIEQGLKVKESELELVETICGAESEIDRRLAWERFNQLHRDNLPMFLELCSMRASAVAKKGYRSLAGYLEESNALSLEIIKELFAHTSESIRSFFATHMQSIGASKNSPWNYAYYKEVNSNSQHQLQEVLPCLDKQQSIANCIAYFSDMFGVVSECKLVSNDTAYVLLKSEHTEQTLYIHYGQRQGKSNTPWCELITTHLCHEQTGAAIRSNLVGIFFVTQEREHISFQELKVLCHELGHAFEMLLNDVDDFQFPAKGGLPKQSKELYSMFCESFVYFPEFLSIVTGNDINGSHIRALSLQPNQYREFARLLEISLFDLKLSELDVATELTGPLFTQLYKESVEQAGLFSHVDANQRYLSYSQLFDEEYSGLSYGYFLYLFLGGLLAEKVIAKGPTHQVLDILKSESTRVEYIHNTFLSELDFERVLKRIFGES